MLSAGRSFTLALLQLWTFLPEHGLSLKQLLIRGGARTKKLRVLEGNVGYDVKGHMFFVETGMENFNLIEQNLAVGAVPLYSGMMESDQAPYLPRSSGSKQLVKVVFRAPCLAEILCLQEPSGFWTAAPNNIWRDNVAAWGPQDFETLEDLGLRLREATSSRLKLIHPR